MRHGGPLLRGLLFVLLTASLPAAELHPYCWGFLNAHPDRADLPQEEAQEIQKGHLAHMDRMAAMGRLLAAGPLATPGGARGLLVYRCESVGQAEEWTRQDPAVVRKRLVVEMYFWNAAGLWGEPLASRRKADPGAKLEMVQLPFAVVEKSPAFRGADRLPEEVRTAHAAYADRLLADGHLRSHGLFTGAADKWGIFVYSAMDMEAAARLAEQDPIVKSGWGRVAMHRWYVADETVPGYRPPSVSGAAANPPR